MRTEKDVEAYLLRLSRRFRTVDGHDGTFLVETATGMPPVAVRVQPPLVVLRVNVGEIDGEPAGLFRKLLELNAKQLVHASYGLDDGRIVLSSALELENLDFNEVQATLDEMDMVLAQQLPELVRLAKASPR
jgi:Tir chaperone family protein CesT